MKKNPQFTDISFQTLKSPEINDKEFVKRRNKALDLIAQRPDVLKTYLEKFPSSKTIEYLDNLSTLPDPEIRDIHNMPESSLFDQDKTISGYLQITQNETLIYRDESLKKDPRLILDGLSRGIKSNPEIASKIINLTQASNDEILSAICAATSRQGFLIYVPENYKVNNPMVIDLKDDAFTGQFTPLQFLIFIGENASADILINFDSQKSDSTGSLFAIELKVLLNRGSVLNLFEAQQFSCQTDLALSETVKISENASLNYFAFDGGGLFVERRLHVNLDEVYGNAQITGLYKPGDQSTYHYSTSQNHIASFTKSDLLYKGVLGGEARMNWEGNILVVQDTKGVDGYQMNSSLLTSKKVQVNSIPGLEILTDDVRCSHGVTMSDIDEGQRLYLQSRGISQANSEQLIIDGFLNKAFERAEGSKLSNLIKGKLPGSMGADL